MRISQKRCFYCHRWFRPNRRKIFLQKVCLRRSCQKRRHKRDCQEWREKNPGQDQGRRMKIQKWAKAYPDYWCLYRATHPAYVLREKQRRRRAHQAAKNAAKRDSIQAISVGKLREIQEMDAENAAKRDSLDRRVDSLLDFLIWKEIAAKEDAALSMAP